MSYKVTPPNLKNSKSYELFKKELDIGELRAPVLEEMRGAVIAVLLPNDCKLVKDLKEDKHCEDKIFESVSVQVLASKDGLKLLKEFLNEELKEDDSEKQVWTLDELKTVLGRGPGASSTKDDPRGDIIVFKIVLGRVPGPSSIKDDPSGDIKVFKNIELKISLGRVPRASSSTDDSSGDIKVFKDMLNEDVLYAAGNVWRDGRGSNQVYHRGRGGGKVDRSNKDYSSKPYQKVKRRTSWSGEDENPSTCHHFGSIYHYLSKCPDRKEYVNIIRNEEAVEKVLLFTDDFRELNEFSREALN